MLKEFKKQLMILKMFLKRCDSGFIFCVFDGDNLITPLSHYNYICIYILFSCLIVNMIFIYY